MVIFKGVFGSHLYGLNTSSSDIDYKQVIMPSARDLIFCKDKVIENHSETEDVSVMSVISFVNNLRKADTVTMDMIHTPKEFTLSSSPLWCKIRELRSDAYSKNMRGVLGYIKTQTSKYGHKEERLREMTELLEIIQESSSDKAPVSDVVNLVLVKNYKHIKFVPKVEQHTQAAVEIIGKKIQCTWSVGELKKFLEANIAAYGNRTNNALLARGDWKSLSHSYRALLQLHELIKTRDIKFPLTYADQILPVKLGKLDSEEVRSILTDLYDEVTSDLENSDLPETADLSRIENIVLDEIFTKRQ